MLGKCRVPSCQQVQMHGAIGSDNAGGIVFHASRDVLEDLVQMAVAQAPELHDHPRYRGCKKGVTLSSFLVEVGNGSASRALGDDHAVCVCLLRVKACFEYHLKQVLATFPIGGVAVPVVWVKAHYTRHQANLALEIFDTKRSSPGDDTFIGALGRLG